MTSDSTTDLSKRLRNDAGCGRKTRLEAADEIDRLTKALKEADAGLLLVDRHPIASVYNRAVTAAISAARARKDQS